MTTGDELADLLIVALVIAIEVGFFGRFAPVVSEMPAVDKKGSNCVSAVWG